MTMRYMKNLLVVTMGILLLGCGDISELKEELNTLGHIGLEPRTATKVMFYSESLQRDMGINVMLPRGYASSDLRYPVLYLCHGFTSNLHEFEYVGVPEYLNRMDMIVITVDVGNSSYVNWAASEDGRPLNFADHVTQDVIGYVDSNYRTIAERKGRAINGISMGGFGAMSLGLSNPDLFCSVASASGSLNSALRQRERVEKGEKPAPAEWWVKMLADTTLRYRGVDIEGFTFFGERTPRGEQYLNVEQVDAVDPFKLVLQIPKDQLPHIYIDCGTEDFLYQAARDFMQLLLDNNIPFTYSQSEGEHEEDYWGREMQLSMATQYSIMLRNIWGREFQRYDMWAEKE